MEFGLCCLFAEEPIRFRSYSFSHLKKIAAGDGAEKVLRKIEEVWENNRSSLQAAISYCSDKGIRGFRISSDLYPQASRLIEAGMISSHFYREQIEQLRGIDASGVVLSMHPGQHVNLGTPTESVLHNSLVDLEEHFAVAEAVGAGEINIHLGGVYGDKSSAVARFTAAVRSLPEEKAARITLENDELNYSLPEVVAVAKDLNLRVVYDIHHQRCHELKYPAEGTVRDYYELARSTWSSGDLQRLHISSPREGFSTIMKSRPHHDYIQPEDIPEWLWRESVLVDIEAKKKELAVQELQQLQNNLLCKR